MVQATGGSYHIGVFGVYGFIRLSLWLQEIGALLEPSAEQNRLTS